MVAMMPDLLYLLWLTVSIFVSHWVTDKTGIEAYAVKNRIGWVLLFLAYFMFLIIFDWIWSLG